MLREVAANRQKLNTDSVPSLPPITTPRATYKPPETLLTPVATLPVSQETQSVKAAPVSKPEVFELSMSQSLDASSSNVLMKDLNKACEYIRKLEQNADKAVVGQVSLLI